MTDKTRRPTRRYDDEFRAGAVLMLKAAGWPNTPGASERVAQHLGVARRVIERWARGQHNPPPDALVHKKSAELVDNLRAFIDQLLGLMRERASEAEFRELATAFGIAVDKLQILTNQPTANVSNEIIIRYADENNEPDAGAQD